MVLIQIEGTVTSKRSEQISVLGEVSHTPNGWIVGQLGQACIALLRMIGLHIEGVILWLKRGHSQFVHINVRSVKFETADTVPHICVPAQAVRSQIKQLNVTIVITSRKASLFLVVGISECNCPTVRFNSFVLRGFKTDDRCLLSGIPNANTSIGSACDQFWCSKIRTFASDTIDLVTHVSMGLHIELFYAALNVINDQLSFIVDCGDIAHTNWTCLECARFDTELFLPFWKQLEVAPL